MLYEKEISFRFKGNRTYVHGTDIFDKILDTSRTFFKEYPTWIKGSFHRLLTNDAIFQIYNDSDTINNENFYARFSIKIKDNSYQFLINSAKFLICSSYEYNEEMVLDKMVIEGKKARMTAKSSYTYIEQLVSMTKKLHLIIYPNTTPKWLFTKIEIRDVLDPALYPKHELAIVAQKNFHNKLTQNAILYDGIYLGNIWFSKAE